nr:MAG TPA: hypothetical protein [Caudoviricetes sp.]
MKIKIKFGFTIQRCAFFLFVKYFFIICCEKDEVGDGINFTLI